MTPIVEKEIIKLPSDQDISGRTFGAEEIAAVTEVLQSGVLITTKGKYGKLLESSFAAKLGVKYAYACNSDLSRQSLCELPPNPNCRRKRISRPFFQRKIALIVCRTCLLS